MCYVLKSAREVLRSWLRVNLLGVKWQGVWRVVRLPVALGRVGAAAGSMPSRNPTLEKYFGYTEFGPGQLDAILPILHDRGELFQEPYFKANLALVAVDEAHCIQEWLVHGHKINASVH